MPAELKPGILYASDEFGIAVHLCACGCGTKIRTPLGPTEWSLEETSNGPSLFPSVGNWQHKCQSHYWIDQGDVAWAEKWTPDQIAEGRRQEEERRREYFLERDRLRGGVLTRVWRWIMNLLSRR